jgi:hypothetical protein
MATNASLNDVIDRLKAEGQLTRNSGKHSIKTIKEILLESQRNSLQDKEDAREAGVKQDRQLEILGSINNSLGKAASGGTTEDSGNGGFFGKLLGGGLGGILGGAGIGAAGLGVLAFGGSALIDSIANLDAQKIKDNINILLSIGDDLEGTDKSLFADGGTLAIVLGGIGIGLGAFALGSGVTAAVDYFSKDSKWAEDVVWNVSTLLTIKDYLGGNLNLLADGVTFSAAMGAIGLGLGAFALGSGVAAAVDYFSKDNFAEAVVNNVVTLLSIDDKVGGNLSMLADGVTFTAAMGTIAAGLVAFSAGNAAAAVAQFMSTDDWAKRIVDNVTTLLSIKDIEGMSADSVAGVSATMTALGLGLAAFGFGSAAAGVGEAINKFSGNEDFSQTIYDRVEKLISITDMLPDGDSESGKAGTFALGMGKLAAGIAAFTLSDGVGSLVSAGQAVLSFFGAKSPFEKLMEIAENADELEKGGNALEKITEGLNAFGNINVSDVDVDFETMGRNLSKAIPFLQAASAGGTVEGGWFSSDVEFGPYKGPGKGGILDPDLNLERLAMASRQMSAIFGGGDIGGLTTMGAPEAAAEPMVERLNAIQEYNANNLGNAQTANSELQMQNNGGGARVDASTIATDNSTNQTFNGNTYNVKDQNYSPYNHDSDMYTQPSGIGNYVNP